MSDANEVCRANAVGVTGCQRDGVSASDRL